MLSTNEIKYKIITYLQQEIFSDSELHDNIVSVMGIGGLAKNKPKIHDIDLNIFTDAIDSKMIIKIKRMLSDIEKLTGLSCDVNIIDFEFYKDNICSSGLFIHTNRHSLFLYELSQVKCLLYGQDILQEYHIRYSDLITESLKLTATLVHRFNKEWVVKGKSIIKQAKKYARYALEFSLIFSGYQNPYLLDNKEIFLKIYPELITHKIINDFWNTDFVKESELPLYYDFIVSLSRIMLQRYKALISRQIPSNKLAINGEQKLYPYFLFPSKGELDEFFNAMERVLDYKKISVTSSFL